MKIFDVDIRLIIPLVLAVVMPAWAFWAGSKRDRQIMESPSPLPERNSLPRKRAMARSILAGVSDHQSKLQVAVIINILIAALSGALIVLQPRILIDLWFVFLTFLLVGFAFIYDAKKAKNPSVETLSATVVGRHSNFTIFEYVYNGNLYRASFLTNRHPSLSTAGTSFDVVIDPKRPNGVDVQNARFG